MTVTELTRDEMIELKGRYYTELLDKVGESPGYGDIAAVDSLVDDKTIYEVYEGVDFVKDDFFCNGETLH